MGADARLAELGIVLPPVSRPAIFGDPGRHTRSAVGMAELPFDIAVEIEMIAELHPAAAAS